ncbi:MAG: hypothetical protein WCI55_16085 [Armatimonadota bacterium]
MEQHKPKHDRIILSDQDYSHSTSYQEEVIILPPGQEQVVQIESKRSFVLSLLLRIGGLCIGSAMALFFLSHYVPADIATLQAFSLGSSATWLLLGVFAAALSRIYVNSAKDQALSIEELKAKSSKIISKPLLSYLGWTFFFFVFAFFGPSWFRWVAAYFIFNAGANLKFRPSGFLNLTSWPAGAARFQSFKFRK